MLFEQPMMLHSQLENGRHWVTLVDIPSIQILPVAANQCRAAHFLARVVGARLANAEELPEELTLTRADVGEPGPELSGEAGEVRVRFDMQPAPPDVEGLEPDDEDDDDDPVLFVTPLPPEDWPGDYDAWIHSAARRLGLDAPPPGGVDGYASELAAASAEVQRRLPDLRERFGKGMGELKMGLKVGLPTRSGGTEFVWMMPLEWPAGGSISCRLQSEPADCAGYKSGQLVTVAEGDVMDYVIGSEKAGIVDPGLTDRIAQNYGLVIG